MAAKDTYDVVTDAVGRCHWCYCHDFVRKKAQGITKPDVLSK